MAIETQTVVDAGMSVFLILVAIIFLILGCILIAKGLSFNFGNGEINEYSRLLDGNSGRGNVPHEFLNDEEAMTHLAEEYDLTGVSPEELSAYRLGEEFTQKHPRSITHIKGGSFTNEDLSLIKDKGIEAFEFVQESPNNILNAKFIVADKTDLLFQNNSEPYSTATAMLNYPLPVIHRTHADTIYFETKVYEFDNSVANAHFSIGLVTKPYPSQFRLPGYNNFSIAYESTGNLKINKPLPTPLQQHMGENSKYNAQVLPPLQQSDVVGFGYVIPSGTLFITRNGKKILDVMSGLYLDLFPAIGCFLTNGRFQVNIGQLGFVWVEANVKKYAFVSTSDYRKIRGEQGMTALPDYGTLLLEDTILAKGEELPPDYPEEELDFFGRSIQANTSAAVGGGTTGAVGDNTSSPRTSQPKLNEKANLDGSFSQITNEPEEVMDLRERIYEQATTNDESNSVLTPISDKNQDDEATGQTESITEQPSQEAAPLESTPPTIDDQSQPDSSQPQSGSNDFPASNCDVQQSSTSENTPEPNNTKTKSTGKKKKKKGKSSKKKGKKK